MVDKVARQQGFVRRHYQLPSPTSFHKPYAIPPFYHRRHQLLRRCDITFLILLVERNILERIMELPCSPPG